ncbi:MAG: redoxin domain-containing protein [Cyclobacteriaceae bacterium]|nr:redoxin domain-containing protein [Cyclobacteriaceae bacterium]
MARKLILTGLMIILLIMIALLAWKYQNKTKTEVQIQDQMKVLPDFSLKTFDGSMFSIREFAAGKPSLIIYFNSTCEMCNLELNALNERFAEFNLVKILLVSSQDKEELEEIYMSLAFLKEPNVKLVLDKEMKLSAYLGMRSVPGIYCYNHDGNLIANYLGPVKMDVLLSQLLNTKIGLL